HKEFQDEYQNLPYHPDSKACKVVTLQQLQTGSEKLKTLLKNRIANKNIKGCRLTANNETVPFTGTQVHGYTLEHELGITTNADKNGDIFGIELKCFTSKKLTLFTPEPDGGLYSESFEEFMCRYGYSKEAVYRFTGLHRAGEINNKSQLKLAVLCSAKKGNDDLIDYDIKKPFKDQLKNLQVVLMDDANDIAASWSITRLFNNWGVKHNEVVYVPASVEDNTVVEEVALGFTRRVFFGAEVLWCRRSTLEHMLTAIVKGTIFLDPAPKFDADNPKNNKRRSQWRINNIYRDAPNLYESVETITF
ncbi:MAG: MvaI/BcnI family restriction endonuclease, partial [Venatoribacter sp.]